jgi:serine/threonine protein kinase
MTNRGFLQTRCGISEGTQFSVDIPNGNSRIFKTLKQIGIGGTGEVWKAEDTDSDSSELVVIKFFTPAREGSQCSFIAPVETDQARIVRLQNAFRDEALAVKEAPDGTTPKFIGAALEQNPPRFAVRYHPGVTLVSALYNKSFQRMTSSVCF